MKMSSALTLFFWLGCLPARMSLIWFMTFPRARLWIAGLLLVFSFAMIRQFILESEDETHAKWWWRYRMYHATLYGLGAISLYFGMVQKAQLLIALDVGLAVYLWITRRQRQDCLASAQIGYSVAPPDGEDDTPDASPLDT